MTVSGWHALTTGRFILLAISLAAETLAIAQFGGVANLSDTGQRGVIATLGLIAAAVVAYRLAVIPTANAQIPTSVHPGRELEVIVALLAALAIATGGVGESFDAQTRPLTPRAGRGVL